MILDNCHLPQSNETGQKMPINLDASIYFGADFAVSWLKIWKDGRNCVFLHPNNINKMMRQQVSRNNKATKEQNNITTKTTNEE